MMLVEREEIMSTLKRWVLRFFVGVGLLLTTIVILMLLVSVSDKLKELEDHTPGVCHGSKDYCYWIEKNNPTPHIRPH
jgi:uncharacterized BrkB/YihY/UPF0761 family membrane protein